MEVEKKLQEIMNKALANKEIEYTIDTEFRSIGVESLELLKFIIYIEEEFKIDIKTELLAKGLPFIKASDVLNLIKQKETSINENRWDISGS